MARRTQPALISPSLPPEKAHAALTKQLRAVEELEGKDYQEGEPLEREWQHLTQSLIERAFGNPSSNLSKYYSARSAGDYQMIPYGGGVPHGLNQQNFNTRIREYKSLLRSLLAELELDLPVDEPRGVYAPGEEYEFYRDLKSILSLGKSDVLVVDPYANLEIFDVYAVGISRAATFRLLCAQIPADLLHVAQKYATGGNFQLRTSNEIHDRVIFVDDRVWVAGQSIKDAAKRKPTYIVEHDAVRMKDVYEPIWNGAKVVI